MNYDFKYQDDFLVIKLSGLAETNERLLAKKNLLLSLRPSCRKIIVDLEDIGGRKGVYSAGVLNTIQKEIQLMAGEMKLCSLTPEVSRYFKENRLDEIFDIMPSIEQAKRSFCVKKDG